jgi:serine/threonine protein kinase
VIETYPDVSFLVWPYFFQVGLLSWLRHPNIVLFMGTVVHPDLLAIVSEFVPRGSLFRQIHELRSNIAPKQLLEMAKDVARGVLQEMV